MFNPNPVTWGRFRPEVVYYSQSSAYEDLLNEKFRKFQGVPIRQGCPNIEMCRATNVALTGGQRATNHVYKEKLLINEKNHSGINLIILKQKKFVR